MSAPDAEAEAKKTALLSLGLIPKMAETLMRNSKLSSTVLEVAEEGGVDVNSGGSCETAVGNLLQTLATKYPAQAAIENRAVVARAIVDGRINTVAQLDGGIAYCKHIGVKELPFVDTDFEVEAGIGVVVTPEDIAATVTQLIGDLRAELAAERYKAEFVMLAQVRKQLRWADGKIVKAEVDRQVLAEFGPVTEADWAQKKGAGKKKEKGKKEKGQGQGQEASSGSELAGGADGGGGGGGGVDAEVEVERKFQMPEENDINTVANLKKHLEETGGVVRTRFPPEPNGYLHIGHAKAMYLDFNYAVKYNGVCLLRFDDTNPEKEKQEYIDSIKDIIQWLGHKPSQVTYSSDYFDELYDFALVLIKKGLAYVDESTREQMAEQRETRTNSPWRERAIDESMDLFLRMKAGEFPEGRYTLRLKMDMQNDNPVMRDLIAYRIKHMPHPMSGDKWCIYPSYDYTHCIVDSIENITHSLCTLEFQVRRDSYYWLLEALDIFKPIVWEFSRLNLTGTVMSKRKIESMVSRGVVDGWDDPRLFTLASLRRRGFTPSGINSFCQQVGVSRSEQMIQMMKLEQVVREDLDASSPRAFVVTEPLRVVITNYPEDKIESLPAPKFPKDKAAGERSMPFSRVIYIEKSDFRMEDEKGYYGLAPGKEVRLRYAYVIKCTGVVKREDGELEVHVTYDSESSSKPKGNIHWIAEPAPGVDPARAELHLLDPLFDVDVPESLGEDWINMVNRDSLGLCEGAMIEPVLADLGTSGTGDGAMSHEYSRIQAERMGYFCIDRATPRKEAAAGGSMPVLIRTLTLREAKGKQ